MKYKDAEEKARKLSIGNPYPVFLYVIDLADDVDYLVTADESYIDSQEFISFNGEVLAEFFDGVEC
jgi:hypothetical protein